MKKYRIFGLTLVLLVFLFLAGRVGYQQYQDTRHTYSESHGIDISHDAPKSVPEDNVSKNEASDQNNQTSALITQSKPESNSTQPTRILLNVPFTPQAPLANWDAVHEQTCEEAAVLMAVYALNGKELNPQLAEGELLKLVDWQKAQFGYFEDTNAEETAQIITDYFGKQADVIYDFTIDDIMRSLTQKKPVIVLAAGRLLGNPFYKQPGPIYHALVIRGFDGDTLITNDPGTRRGERYTYQSSVILNAAHEWVGDPERLAEGRRAMITIGDSK